MWPLLRKKNSTLLGLDIDCHQIKVVELSQYENHYRLENYAKVDLPPDAVVENIIKDIPAVACAIETAISQAGSKLKSIATYIPYSAVITKVINMDAALEENELAEYVHLEASRYIPYPQEDVALDFTLLEPAEKTSNKTQILFVVARKEHMKARIEAIQLAGLNPKVMDVAPYAMARACQLIPDISAAKWIALINIHDAFTTITLLQDFKAVYHHEEILGSPQPVDTSSDAYISLGESLAALIRRSLQLFFSNHPFNKIEKVVIAGDSQDLPELAKFITNHLALPCIVADPFANMITPSNIHTAVLMADSSSLLLACGLALRSFK